LFLLFQIVWLENWEHGNADGDNVPIFLVSVHAVHCRIQEPTHPYLSKNPDFYSHKFKQAGLNYELAVLIYDNKLVWLNGPFPASRHDISIFRTAGLKEKIPDGKLVVGDNGYRGEPDIISAPNSHDRIEVRKFKRRARARHARIKNFHCLAERFRHNVDDHVIVFEAVCVIC
jgi:hypothetical protein